MRTSRAPAAKPQSKPSARKETNLPGVKGSNVNRKVRSHPNQQAARAQLNPAMETSAADKRAYELATFRAARKSRTSRMQHG